MSNAVLLNLLTDCTGLLNLGNRLGLDLSNQVQELLTKNFNTAPEGQIRIEAINGNRGYEFVPEMTADEVQVACYTGGKLEAIKMYRNRTGLSLLQAKRAVETDIESMGHKFYRPF